METTEMYRERMAQRKAWSAKYGTPDEWINGRRDATEPVRKFKLQDSVQLSDTDLAGTIVQFLSADAGRDLTAAIGTGPLYLVNVGNVFDEAYQSVYAESELTPACCNTTQVGCVSLGDLDEEAGRPRSRCCAACTH